MVIDVPAPAAVSANTVAYAIKACAVDSYSIIKQVTDIQILATTQFSPFTHSFTMPPTWALQLATTRHYPFGHRDLQFSEMEKHAVYVVHGESADLLKLFVVVGRLVAAPVVHSGTTPTHHR